MKIAIASGKGGTGKTTVCVNLLYGLKKYVKDILMIDADVEEPNIALFFKKRKEKIEKVYSVLPELIKNNCTQCGKCENICQYKALVTINKCPVIIEDLCKGCKLCIRVCEDNALIESKKTIGQVSSIQTEDNLKIVSGKLNVGQILTSTLISKVKEKAFQKNESVYLIDSPPGTTCPAVEAIKGSDYVVFVAEPTPYGIKDLMLAIDLAQNLNKRYGVIINKDGYGNKELENLLVKKDIKIIGKIPYLDNIARQNSEGKILFEYSSRFHVLAGNLLREVGL
ncbi:MAG: P-loop NTPase [Candidatus Muiribacteriota bacterium]